MLQCQAARNPTFNNIGSFSYETWPGLFFLQLNILGCFCCFVFILKHYLWFASSLRRIQKWLGNVSVLGVQPPALSCKDLHMLSLPFAGSCAGQVVADGPPVLGTVWRQSRAQPHTEHGGRDPPLRQLPFINLSFLCHVGTELIWQPELSWDGNKWSAWQIWINSVTWFLQALGLA